MKENSLSKILDPLAHELFRGRAPRGGDPALAFNAVVEAAYLVMAARGAIDDAERHTFKEAVRLLADGMITGGEIESLIRDLADLHARDGGAERARVVGALLRRNHAVAPGIRLGAVLAYTSLGLHAPEMKVLGRLADAAGLPPEQLALMTMEMRPAEDL